MKRTLDIYPTMGMIAQIPAKLLPLGASPDMLNMYVYGGQLRKRPGYAQFADGNAPLGDPIVGIASVQDEENATHLFAITEDGLFKWNGSDWDAMTGPALTGTGDRLFSWEVSQNSFVFSQGVDQVHRIPFNTTTYAILNANCPPARYMTRFADRLFLASTVESAASKPFRIRRPVAADHTNWTGVGSGFTDLSEFPYHLKGLRKLGTRLAAYTEKAVWIGTRTGDASAPVRFEPIVTESGLYAAFTLKGRKNMHMFLGTDDIYEFNGSVSMEVAGPVRDMIFGNINAASIDRCFAEVLADTQEYLVFICTGGSSSPDKVWVFNYGRRIWYPWSVNGPQCATLHRLDSTTTWDSLTGVWDDYLVEWDSAALQAAFPALLTGNNDGMVYIWGPSYFSDNGSPIRCYWSSKDLSAEDVGEEFRGKSVTLRGVTVWYKDQGTDFSVELFYSVDGGATWDGPYVTTVTGSTAGEKSFRVDRQITGDTVRFRIEQESADETLIISLIQPELEVRGMQTGGTLS